MGVRITLLRPSFPLRFQNVRKSAYSRLIFFDPAWRQPVAKYGEKIMTLHFLCSALLPSRRLRRGAHRKRNHRRLARLIRCLNIIRRVTVEPLEQPRRS